MTAADFISQMLRQIQAEFFAGAREKEFYQQVPMLKSAITYPAKWLREKGGWFITPALMLRILTTVISTIKQRGAKQHDRFCVYFLHCVQQHMKHAHGDRYLQEAKRMPAAGDFVAGALHQVKTAAGSGAADLGAVLAETNRALGRISRRRAVDSNSVAGDLFDRCNAPAKRKRFPKPLQLSPDPAENSSNRR